MTWVDPNTQPGSLPDFQNWENFGADTGGGGYNVPPYGPQTPIIGTIYLPAPPPPPPPVVAQPPPVVAQPPTLEQLPPPVVEVPPSFPLPPLEGPGELTPEGEAPPDIVGLEDLIQLEPYNRERHGPALPPGGLWSRTYEDGSSEIGRRPIRWPDERPPPPWPINRGEWGWDPGRGFHENFVARAPRPRPIEQPPFPSFPSPWPWPFPRRAAPRPREPVRSRRRLDELFPNRIPEPLPSERAPYPVLPPRVPVETPTLPDEIPLPVPQPRIPVPEPEIRTSPLPPQPAPPLPRVPSPQPLPQPLPQRRTRVPRFARWPRVAGPLAATVPILRRYLARRDEPEPAPRFDFRDLVPEPAGLPLQPQPQPIAPQPIAPASVLPELPPLPDLTPINAPALPFAQPFTEPSRRTKECRCEDETEEEAEERRERNASSVVAEVKTYRRRMSQNSLDNLR